MKRIIYGVFTCALLCSLALILGSTSESVSAETYRSEAADLMLVGGSCGGSCGPGDCGSGETRQDNCTSCSGQDFSGCNCKGKYQCYDAKGVKVGGGKCSGPCKWTKGKVEAEESYQELLGSDSDADPLRSSVSSW